VVTVEPYDTVVFHIDGHHGHQVEDRVHPEELKGTYSAFVNNFGDYLDREAINYYKSPHHKDININDLTKKDNIWHSLNHSIIQDGDNQRELLKEEATKYSQIPIDPMDTFSSSEGGGSIMLPEGLTERMVSSKEIRQDAGRKG